MDETADLLARLEEEARALSRRRRQLHERIDFARASAFGDPDAAARLVKLEADEQELSRKRRELHSRIDALRGQSGPT
jgi:chromosome segregation ATPase